MSYLLLLHPEFEVELTKAAIWYEERLQGLGVDFVVSVKQGIQLVEREPELFPVVYKSIRRILLKKFPYKVYYELTEDKIVILAIIHHSRDTNSRKRKFLKRKI